MTNIDYKILKSGYCYQNELCSIAKGKNHKTKFFAMAVLINHPQKGYILYDTGYSEYFYSAAKKFPYSLYGKITPVVIDDKTSLKNKLLKLNISPEQISYVIISHFHADHISGLKDFKNAKFICLENCYKNIKDKKGFFALKKAFLPDLLPDDFEKRLEFANNKSISDKFLPFREIYDIFNDGSVVGIELSGHAKGQMGIIIDKTFFVSDACWYSKSYRENLPPPLWVRLLLCENKTYLETLNKLHNFYKQHSDFKIIPSHCNEFWSNYA